MELLFLLAYLCAGQIYRAGLAVWELVYMASAAIVFLQVEEITEGVMEEIQLHLPVQKELALHLESYRVVLDIIAVGVAVIRTLWRVHKVSLGGV